MATSLPGDACMVPDRASGPGARGIAAGRAGLRSGAARDAAARIRPRFRPRSPWRSPRNGSARLDCAVDRQGRLLREPLLPCTEPALGPCERCVERRAEMLAHEARVTRALLRVIRRV